MTSILNIERSYTLALSLVVGKSKEGLVFIRQVLLLQG